MVLKNQKLQSRSSPVLDKVYALLGDLRSTTAGRIIHGHIEQMLGEMVADHNKTEEAYASFLNMLLEACLSQIPADNPLHTHLRLVQMRLMPPLSVSELGALNRCMEGISDQMVDAKLLHGRRFAKALMPVLTRFGAEGSVTEMATPVVDSAVNVGAEPIADHTPVQQQAEQRMNAAYRAHLDEKRETMQRLQSDFVAQMDEAVAEYDAFGELLDSALCVMREAGDADEQERRRQEIIQSLQLICEGHKTLATKFSRAQEYLYLIEDDNQQLSDELDRVRLLSLTDELTGLPNRRAFMRRLEDEVSRVQRHGTPLSLVIMDLDFFKKINDERGHPAGDAVLRHYAQSVLSIFRHHDLVARYGGEEFAVLLPNTDQIGVLRALEKVRRRLLEVTTQLEDEEGVLLPTYSAGVAEYSSGETAHRFIERADAALYAAKRNGRDRVELHTECGVSVDSGPADGQGSEPHQSGLND